MRGSHGEVALMTEINIDRAELEADLRALHKARDEAAMAAIAESKLIARRREIEAAEQVRRVKELKVELKAHTAAYLEDIRLAEQSARALAAAIGRALESAKAIAR